MAAEIVCFCTAAFHACHMDINEFVLLVTQAAGEDEHRCRVTGTHLGTMPVGLALG